MKLDPDFTIKIFGRKIRENMCFPSFVIKIETTLI